jgi:hypothetical protein
MYKLIIILFILLFIILRLIFVRTQFYDNYTNFKYVKYKLNISAGLSHQTSNLNAIIKEAFFNNQILILPNFKLIGIHNNGKDISSNLSKYYDYNNIKINNNKYKVILDDHNIDNKEIKTITIHNQLANADTNIKHSEKKLNIKIPYNKSIIEIANNISYKLGKYICIHIRRGDMLSLKQNLDKDTSVDNILSKLNKFKTKFDNIYIMTNEKNLKMYNKINIEFPNKIFFYKDFEKLVNIEDNYYLFCIEKNIINNANIKISTFKTKGIEYDDYLSDLFGWQ